jgi:hypothetical protein
VIYDRETQLVAEKERKESGSIDKFVVYGGDFTKSYLKWAINSFLPLSTCDNPYFRSMCKTLSANANILCYSTAMSEVHRIEGQVQLSIKEFVLGRPCALTTDHWTSIANENYMCVTLHTIDDNWKIRSLTLSCEEHTNGTSSCEIVAALTDVWTRFGLKQSDLIAIVTDSAANMSAAGRKYPCPLHYCLAHVIELTAKKVMKDDGIPGLAETMKACRGLVGHFKSSSQDTAKLLEVQTLGEAVGVVQDVSTRWWSTYQMLDRLLKLKSYFGVLQSQGIISCNLTDEQWIMVSKYCKILKPFMLVQRALEGEKYVTASTIPYCIHKIRELLTPSPDADVNDPIVMIQKALLEDFNKRWGKGAPGTVILENETYGSKQRQKGIPKLIFLACALDPRTKSLCGIPTEEHYLLWKLLHERMMLLFNEHDSVVGVNKQGVIDLTITDEDALYADLVTFGSRDLSSPTETPSTNINHERMQLWENHVVDEIARYKEIPQLDIRDKTINPLTWWKGKVDVFPIMSKVARQVLCIPATSAPAERVFSAAGHTISQNRASLRSDNAASIIFFHDSWNVMEEIETESRKRKRPEV